MKMVRKILNLKNWFFSILALALVRGFVYAVYLPPWGLNDEQQHFHYIQSISENGAIPVVGKDYISQEIAISSYETRRREIFHWPPYPSLDPRDWGLEGHSYEGYQPPLYYLLLAPVHRFASLITQNTLMKLQILKWTNVLLSLTTVFILKKISEWLFSNKPYAPFFLCSLLVWWPERTMSVSRVNNDVLTEIFGAFLYFLLIKIGQKTAVYAQDGLLIGIVLGLGVLTKMTFLPWVCVILYVVFTNFRKNKKLLMSIAVLAIMIAPHVIRSLVIYGDPTGFSSFQKLAGRVSTPESNLYGLVKSISEFLVYLWVVWWKGSIAGGSIAIKVYFYIYFGLFYTIIINGLRKLIVNRRNLDELISFSIGTSIVSICIFSLSIMSSYYAGLIPILQGRFMLPVVIPILVLVGYGLLYLKHGEKIASGFLFAFVAIDIAQMFGNLIPYFYYFSDFSDIEESYRSKNFSFIIFIRKFLIDKPHNLHWLLGILFVLYIFVILIWLLTVKRCWHANADNQ